MKIFGEEIDNYTDKSAFTSGILLFNNCETIKNLFDNINEDIVKRPYDFSCFDQPYIVYNAFKYNCYNNKVLKSLVVNNDNNIHSDKVIHHFPGGPGVYHHKIHNMSIFLDEIKDFTITNNILNAKKYINDHLMPIINNCGELLEGNIFTLHHTTRYTDVFLKKTKNISNLVLNKQIKNVMEIGFNSGFSSLLMLLTNPNICITCFDLGEHTYTIPCYEKLKETFGDKINIIIGNSMVTLQNIPDIYDLIHIDGGHSTEVADSDIKNSYRLSKQGTILIMDDYDFGNLHQLWDSYINKYNLKPLNINIYNCPHHDIKYVNFDIDYNNIINEIKNKTFTWENSTITFLNNNIMNAFGKGNYEFVDKQNIIAKFGGRIHSIFFNEKYTTFTSIRRDDLHIVIGKIIAY